MVMTTEKRFATKFLVENMWMTFAAWRKHRTLINDGVTSVSNQNQEFTRMAGSRGAEQPYHGAIRASEAVTQEGAGVLLTRGLVI